MSDQSKAKKERMDRVLEVWVANPLMPLEQVARTAGVGDRTFYRYRQDPAFMDRYHEACKEKFKSMEGLAMQKLRDAVEDGNWNAVKYILDGMGYKPTEKVDANVNGTQDINITIGE